MNIDLGPTLQSIRFHLCYKNSDISNEQKGETGQTLGSQILLDFVPGYIPMVIMVTNDEEHVERFENNFVPIRIFTKWVEEGTGYSHPPI